MRLRDAIVAVCLSNIIYLKSVPSVVWNAYLSQILDYKLPVWVSKISKIIVLEQI